MWAKKKVEMPTTWFPGIDFLDSNYLAPPTRRLWTWDKGLFFQLLTYLFQLGSFPGGGEALFGCRFFLVDVLVKHYWMSVFPSGCIFRVEPFKLWSNFLQAKASLRSQSSLVLIFDNNNSNPYDHKMGSWTKKGLDYWSFNNRFKILFLPFSWWIEFENHGLKTTRHILCLKK